jgi:hypothetical protein
MAFTGVGETPVGDGGLIHVALDICKIVDSIGVVVNSFLYIHVCQDSTGASVKK